ncbi:MAG TPA: peroxiredoxin [Cytophagales bacterium]|jgi:peroxiredoxin Q/BCP|nr:peroxiredoxin [Cytophagales bacterium]
MALKIGDNLPKFSLYNQSNELILSTSFKNKFLIIFFYPKDNTPGCTKEVCGFRDSYYELKNIDTEIIGISSDSITNHQKFSKNFYINYNLLSDYKKKVRKLFEVPKSFFGLLPGRVTYIFDQNRKLLKIINSQFDINRHISISKKIIKEHKNNE